LSARLRSLANIFYSGVSGVTFENKNVLMAGASAGSIRAEVLQASSAVVPGSSLPPVASRVKLPSTTRLCTLNLGRAAPS